jgi:hypothetical protein
VCLSATNGAAASPPRTITGLTHPCPCAPIAPAAPQVALQLNEQGLNVALYWKNKDPRSFINIVPTSAITGEGE